MTNETLEQLIQDFNRKSFPSFSSFRSLTNTVTLGLVWPTQIRTAANRGYRVYFILSEAVCVAAVLDMGECDLHWYVQEQHRRHGHLHKALHTCVLPHLFSDGRTSQRVTTNSQANADYVIRQGFVPAGDLVFVMPRSHIEGTVVPQGRNSPLTTDEKDAMKLRLLQARALVLSVHEMLLCRYDHDDLGLDDTASTLLQLSWGVGDLNPDGKLERG